MVTRNQLKTIALTTQETKENKITGYEEYKAAIDAVLVKAAQRGEFFYTYSGLREEDVLRLAKDYDDAGFLISVRKDRYNELWSLYLNWS